NEMERVGLRRRVRLHSDEVVAAGALPVYVLLAAPYLLQLLLAAGRGSERARRDGPADLGVGARAHDLTCGVVDLDERTADLGVGILEEGTVLLLLELRLLSALARGVGVDRRALPLTAR